MFLTRATAGYWKHTDWRNLRRGAATGQPAPSVKYLRGRRLIGAGEFLPDERHTVAELARLGIGPIEHVDIARNPDRRTPDGYLSTARMTVEIKILKSAGMISERVKEATEQSRRLILDLRRIRMDRSQGLGRIRAGLEAYGQGYDELLVLGHGWGLLWP